MIKSVKINKFRALDLNGQEILIGKKLTAIAGRNSTGKSTLLAMLGNSVELKKFKTLTGKSFKTEFSSIIKGSVDFDRSGSNLFTVNFTDYNFNDIIDFRVSRISWQGNRFRLIPGRKDDHITTDTKYTLPCIYLGLSRLYPIGEVEDDESIQIIRNNLTPEYNAEFIQLHSDILGNHDPQSTLEQYNISQLKKRSTGIKTSTYDYKTNSSGQDNLSQIIMALLSFKNLKTVMGTQYTGGLLLIDEIDATLHPSAQKNLINKLYAYAKDLNIQVVFTTHSTTILKEIAIKTAFNSPENNGDYEIHYFSKANGSLRVLRNPSYELMKNELLLLSRAQIKKYVKIYTEDDEAAWFLKHLLRDYLNLVEVVSLKLGCLEMINIFNKNPEWCSNGLIILDGDSNNEISINKINRSILKKYLFLPTSNRPEEIFYNYLKTLDAQSQFWNAAYISSQFTRENMLAHGPESTDYTGHERDKYKKWFIDHESIFDSNSLFEYWKTDNITIYNEFIATFKTSFNDLAKHLMISKI